MMQDPDVPERPAAAGAPVLILNAYGPFLRRPVAQALERAGFTALAAADLAEAVEIGRTRRLGGIVVGLNLKQGADGEVLESGLSLLAAFLGQLGDPTFAHRPIMVTVTYRSSSMVVENEARRHRILNPRLLASKDEVLDPAFAGRIRQHFAQGW